MPVSLYTKLKNNVHRHFTRIRVIIEAFLLKQEREKETFRKHICLLQTATNQHLSLFHFYSLELYSMYY
jgi:hypothetical protein